MSPVVTGQCPMQCDSLSSMRNSCLQKWLITLACYVGGSPIQSHHHWCSLDNTGYLIDLICRPTSKCKGISSSSTSSEETYKGGQQLTIASISVAAGCKWTSPDQSFFSSIVSQTWSFENSSQPGSIFKVETPFHSNLWQVELTSCSSITDLAIFLADLKVLPLSKRS